MCDGCTVVFHAPCIGMAELPPDEEEWLCELCVPAASPAESRRRSSRKAAPSTKRLLLLVKDCADPLSDVYLPKAKGHDVRTPAQDRVGSGRTGGEPGRKATAVKAQGQGKGKTQGTGKGKGKGKNRVVGEAQAAVPSTPAATRARDQPRATKTRGAKAKTDGADADTDGDAEVDKAPSRRRSSKTSPQVLGAASTLKPLLDEDGKLYRLTQCV